MMATLLHLDSSARGGIAGTQQHGSYSRYLSSLFVKQWLQDNPQDQVIYRDIGLNPPAHIDQAWIEAAFSPLLQQTPAMQVVLQHSDQLIDELLAADVIVIGFPMYNFGIPSALKAYIDNVVRIGRTFNFDPALDNPYIPLLSPETHLVTLTARGGAGFDAGGLYASMNFAEPHLHTVFGFLGVQQFHQVAIEYQETGGEALQQSIAAATAQTLALATSIGRQLKPVMAVV